MVDVKAQSETGKLVIVEVQNVANAGFISRLLYYIAVNYVKQVNVSLEDFEKKKTAKIDYMSLKPIISVSILNCDLHLQTKRAHSVYRMKECTTGFELTKDWEVHFIELKKELSDESKDLALWIQFFTSKNPEEDKMTIIKENPFFEEVYEKYKTFSGDVELMEKYRDIQAYYITQQHMLNIERQEGLEQGAHDKALTIAESLLEQGLSVELIVKSTGLSEEEVRQINI